MAYEFTKLSEVPVIDTVTNDCNILVEDGGEVKRTAQSNISASRVQANWAEDDESSPAFIMNKPSSLGGGGVTWFNISGSSIYKGNSGIGENASASDVLTAFNSGTVRVHYNYFACCSSQVGNGTVVSYYSYTPSGCGASSVITYRFYYTTSGNNLSNFNLT